MSVLPISASPMPCCTTDELLWELEDELFDDALDELGDDWLDELDDELLLELEEKLLVLLSDVVDRLELLELASTTSTERGRGLLSMTVDWRTT